MNGISLVCSCVLTFAAALDSDWSTMTQDVADHSARIEESPLELTIYESRFDKETLDGVTKSWRVRRTASDQSVILGDHGIPQIFLVAEGIVTVSDASDWESWPQPEWNFELSGSRTNNFHRKATAVQDRRLRIDVLSLLEPVFSHDSVHTYDPVVRAARLQAGPFGSRVMLRRHTPRDQLYTGTQIAAIELNSAKTGTIEIRDFRFRQLSKAQHFPRFAKLVSLSNAKQRATAPVLAWRQIADIDTLIAVRTLNRLDPGSSGAIGVAAKSLSNEVLDFMAKATTIDAAVGTEPLLERISSITAALEVIHTSLAVERRLSRQYTPDDSGLRWNVCHRHVEAFTLKTLHQLVARVVVAQSRMTNSQLEHSVAFLRALAECGRPPSPVLLHILESQQGSASAAFRAILQSHWRLPCRSDDLHVCKVCTTKAESFPVLASACADALIRTGNCSQISTDYRSLWWRDRVQNVSEPARYERLLTISENEQGRTWLLNQLAVTDEASIRAAIMSILRERINAVQETQRWEFMSKAEVKRLEFGLNAAK